LRLLCVGILLWLAAGSTSLAVSINFESVADDTLLSSEFDSLGLRVTGIGNLSGRVLTEGDIGTANYGNSATHIVHVGGANEPTTLWFVDPLNTSVIVGTYTFNLLVGDGNPDSESVDVTIMNRFGEILAGPTTYSTTGGSVQNSGSKATLGERIGSVELNLRSDSPSGITFDDLRFTPVHVSLPGDYNADGRVDAADYVAWRNNVGAPAGTLPNDADGGTIGPSQYNTWRGYFGEMNGAGGVGLGGGLSPGAVPEPGGFILAASLFVLAARRHRLCESRKRETVRKMRFEGVSRQHDSYRAVRSRFKAGIK
jgi:hypothetical protein